MNEFKDFELKPHHLGISVADIEASIAWYGEMLGFTLVKRHTLEAVPAEIAFLSHGDFSIELFEVPGAAPLPEDRRYPNRDLLTHGTKHMALAVQNMREVMDVLKQRDVDIAMDVTMVEQTAIAFIRDPTGNLIELFEQPDLF